MDLSEIPSHPFRRHPWEEARFGFVYRALRAAGLDAAPARILDAGAGDGWFAAQLVRRMAPGTEIVCWDPGYTTRACPPGGGETAGVRFVAARPDGQFDILLLLDVLEHVEDDRSFVRSLVAESLRPGATLLITVPAWPWLFSPHDAGLKHFRRYRPGDCARMLEAAGLEIVESGGLFHAGLPVRAAATLFGRVRRAEATGPEPFRWRHGALAGRLVSDALTVDNRMSAWFSRLGLEVPGLSWWARCRKPS